MDEDKEKANKQINTKEHVMNKPTDSSSDGMTEGIVRAQLCVDRFFFFFAVRGHNQHHDPFVMEPEASNTSAGKRNQAPGTILKGNHFYDSLAWDARVIYPSTTVFHT